MRGYADAGRTVRIQQVCVRIINTYVYIYHAKGLSDAIDALASEAESNLTLESVKLERIGVERKCLSRLRRPLREHSF